VPRGRIRFHATSPPPPWPDDPEGVVRETIERHGGRYIEESLAFSHGGKLAQALFETFEPSEDSRGTDYYGLAEELDGIDVTLYISPELWLQRQSRNRKASAQQPEVGS
jgi:hypothetical protein